MYPETGSADTSTSMDAHTRIHFDELMRVLTVIGLVALAIWVLGAAVGVFSGYAAISPPATLRFLLAVLIVSFSRRTYWELCEWRWRKLPPDERSGFSNPLIGSARVGAGTEDMTEDDGFVTATSSSQARA